MINKKCKHKETNAEGIIKGELKGTDRFPDQWGIFWIKGANHGHYTNHYYWNDKEKIICL